MLCSLYIDLINRTTEAFIGNQQVNIGNGVFAPNTGVNNVANTIDLGYTHGYSTGDQVVYSDGGDSPINGLVDGGVYYTGVVDSTTVRLARTAAEAREDSVTFFKVDAPTDIATNVRIDDSASPPFVLVW